MSFGESISSAGFIQKIINVDLDVRINRVYPQRNTTPEGSRGHQKAIHERRPQVDDRWGRPLGLTCQLSVPMSVLHRLRVCIYAILSSRFDPRA